MPENSENSENSESSEKSEKSPERPATLRRATLSTADISFFVVSAAAPGRSLTGAMALEGCTSHAAVAAGEQDVAGRIAPGYRADLTALDLDPVTAPADELAEAPVRLAMVGGRVTYRAQPYA